MKQPIVAILFALVLGVAAAFFRPAQPYQVPAAADMANPPFFVPRVRFLHGMSRANQLSSKRPVAASRQLVLRRVVNRVNEMWVDYCYGYVWIRRQ
ncbi:hypothetical protein IV203_037565 [Nitzschia inconspicua]|uniref:Uncharacterized protein n=1 Tax=Nitzschia inconspicua TaxID=303405 RepID=A0A9K3PYH4_9STRA|nr:hypothetical protein IV203_037565 [Nitzschia inconspicua]